MKKWMWFGAGIFWGVIAESLASRVESQLSGIYNFPSYYYQPDMPPFHLCVTGVVAFLGGMLTALGFGGGPLAFPDRWFHGRFRGLGRIGTALVYAVSLSLAAFVAGAGFGAILLALGPSRIGAAILAALLFWLARYALQFGLVFYGTASIFAPRVSQEVPRLDLWGRIPPVLLISSLLVMFSFTALRAYISAEPMRTEPIIRGTIDEIWFTPDSKWLVTAGAGIAGLEIKIWDLATKTLAHTIRGLEGRQIRFSTDSQFLAFHTGESRVVEVWDLTRGAKIRDLRASGGGALTMLGFGYDKAAFLTLHKHKEHELQVWDLKSGEVISSVPVTEFDLVRADGSQDGRYVAFVTHKRESSRLFVWDSQAGRLILPDVGQDVWQPKFLDGDKVLAVVKRSPTFEFFRTEDWARMESIREQDRRLLVWEAGLFASDGESRGIWADFRHHWPAVPSFHHAALTSDRSRLVMVSDDDAIRLLDTATGAVSDMCKPRCFQGKRAVLYPVISPDNQWLAVPYEGNISLWNLASRQRADPLREDRPKDFTDPKQSR